MKYVLCFILLIFTSLYSQSVEPEVQKIIDDFMKSLINQSNIREYGFDNTIPGSKFKAGAPIKLYTVGCGVFATFSANDPIRSFFTDFGEGKSDGYVVPLIVDGKIIDGI